MDAKKSAGTKPVIAIYGAREHNLKNLSLVIPRNQLVVVTGVSGSGKSTLAFDLLFAEGQRRFLDSMNAYARQFVEQLPRPEVDLIEGLPPTVSIEQRSTRGGGKSTVATLTEIFHFVRLLYARVGIQYCPTCDQPVQAQTATALTRQLLAAVPARGALQILAPLVKNRKGFHTGVAEWAHRHGYTQIRADGRIIASADRLRLDRFRAHNIELVMGTLDRQALGSRQAEARAMIKNALELGHGFLLALNSQGHDAIYSTSMTCGQCARSFEPLEPMMFSFNSPRGWCSNCRGFGELFYLPEVDRGARADDIEESWFDWQEGKRQPCTECQGVRLNQIARHVRLPVDWPFAGDRPTSKNRQRTGPSLDDMARITVNQALEFFTDLKFQDRAAEVARDVLPEIRGRLQFLEAVGLGYLQLGRGVPTLSSGESQRIRLAAQLGSNLSGVLYLLDEPTIGLHARDNQRLLEALHALKKRGNSLVVVEHDEETMRQADYIVDLGPGAGIHGGELVAAGTLAQLLKHRDSITGQCLRNPRVFPSRGQRRPVQVSKPKPSSRDHGPVLTLHHAQVHNLKDLTVSFPLNRLVLVTGVSGSGKSTLIRECLLPALKATLSTGAAAAAKSGRQPPHGESNPSPVLTGWEHLRGVYEVDQSPIGRTPRSTPATYVGFFDEIRKLFALAPEARLRGYSAGRFSFNSAAGRCAECEGAGIIKLAMSFMPPAFVRCQTCNGLRYNLETLDIQWHGKTIADVLQMTVAEARDFFQAHPRIHRPLQALHDTGLDYLALGQISPTLSGGEAQRLKLVTHLLSGFKNHAAALPSRTQKNSEELHAAPLNPALIFLLEEPTIGLHIADVHRLVEVLQRLVDAGHTVIVIEHNLDLIAEADWIIDLGPEGGDAGGRVVATGTPEDVARNPASHTGRFLSAFLADTARRHEFTIRLHKASKTRT